MKALLHKDFSVRVMSKFSGPFEGLLWYTHNEGQHLVLTKLKLTEACSLRQESTARVAALFQAVVDKHPDAEPRQYIVASTVKPPPEMERLTCENNIERAVITFTNVVHCDMTLFRERGRKLPPQWTVCQKCDGKGHVGDGYDYCPRKDCIGGFQLLGAMTPLAALTKLFDPEHPQRFNWDTPRERGYTPQGYNPSPGDKLYAVGGNFGDHSSGIGVKPIAHDDALPTGTIMLINGHVNVPIPQCILDIRNAAKAEEKAEQAKWRERSIKERRTKDQQVLKQALARYA